MVIKSSKRVSQAKAYLLDYIDQNRLKRNDQLPSESSIAADLGVSRNTLREAYIALENEGIIVRRHGIGTFVAHTPTIRDSLNDFYSFAQIIQDSGYKPVFKTLSLSFCFAPANVYAFFSAPLTQKIRCIKRIVQADKDPVIYVEDYFSPVVEAASLDWEAFDGNTVQFLAAGLTTPLHQIRSSIRAAALSPEIGPILGLPPETPILSVQSIIYTIDNEPVTYSKISFNSNFIEMNIVRTIRAE